MRQGDLDTMRHSGLGGTQPLSHLETCVLDSWGEVRPLASYRIGGRTKSGTEMDQRGRTGMRGALA
jgi:hypothetical protein